MDKEEFLEQADKLDGKDDGIQQTEETKETQAEVEEQEDQGGEELSPTQQEAYKSGWRPQEDFKGDPEDWTPASAYIKFQNMQKQRKEDKADFERQLKENNTFTRDMYKSQLETQRKQFEIERDSAVEEGDTEAFKIKQGQIDDLAKQERKIEAPVDIKNDPDVAAWLARNEWMGTDGRKANDADYLFEQIKAGNPGITTRDALDILDEKLDNQKGKQNPRRTAPSTSETSTRKATPSSKRALTMADLTREEEGHWNLIGNKVFGGNQKSFLESIKNSRA